MALSCGLESSSFSPPRDWTIIEPQEPSIPPSLSPIGSPLVAETESRRLEYASGPGHVDLFPMLSRSSHTKGRFSASFEVRGNEGEPAGAEILYAEARSTLPP